MEWALDASNPVASSTDTLFPAAQVDVSNVAPNATGAAGEVDAAVGAPSTRTTYAFGAAADLAQRGGGVGGECGLAIKRARGEG